MLPDICRLCMKTDFLSSIFEIRDSVCISTMVNNLTKINILPNDGLPNKICCTCLKKLDNCTQFINICQASDAQLRSSVQENDEDVSSKDFKIEYDDENSSPTEYEEIGKVKSNVIDIQITEDLGLKNVVKTDEGDKSSKKSVKQQCFTCGRVMSSMFRLKSHLKTHTGERPFSCEQCNKTFALEQSLKVHMRIHTGEKPLQCPICGKLFAQTAGLAAHKRKHTGQKPYQCVLCPRNFYTHSHLQYHVRRHTGEENFECEVCNKTFVTASGLKQHNLTHTGEKPHDCSVCGKTMARASHVKRHMQRIHKNNAPKKDESKICENERQKPGKSPAVGS